MGKEGQKRSVPQIIDCHVHLGKSVYGHTQSAEDYIRLMKKNGVQKALVSCFTPEDLDFERANRELKRAMSGYPGTLFGAVSVDPRLKKKSERILSEFLKSEAFHAVILNPFEQSFKINDEAFISPVMSLAEKFDVPLIVEAGFPIVSTAFQVGELARKYPKIPVVMTHAGQLLASGQAESDALKALHENVNLYAETSRMTLSGIGGFIQQLLGSNTAQSGKKPASSIIFGSDSPICDLSVEILRVMVSETTEKEKNQILRENAIYLFKLLD
jgi:uncharacterized protein